MQKWAAIAATLGLVTLAGCGGDDGPMTVKGEVVISDQTGPSGGIKVENSSTPKDGDACSGANGYDDIGAGAGVAVKDADGNLIGASTLSAGKLSDYYDVGEGANTAKCIFAFTATDVKDASSEGNTISLGSRKSPALTKDELKDGPSVTIGK